MSGTTQSNGSKRSDNDGKKRRSRRHSGTDNDGKPPAELTPAQPKRLRFSPRFVGDYCYDIQGLEHKNQCDGCQRWNNTLIRKKPRAEFKSKELLCYQAWKLKEKNVPPSKMKHWLAVTNHLSNNLHVNASALAADIDDELIEDEGKTEAETTTVEADNGVTPSPPKRKVNWNSKVVNSQGQEFTIEFPASHELCHISDVKRWQNDSETLNEIRTKLTSNQYQSKSIFTQTLWSVATTSVPALALSAAQFMFPLTVMAYLFDTNIFRGIDITKYAKSFPSETTLRQYNFNQAARDTMSLGHEIRDSKIYIACDKGNKKGIGHFVKYLSWWKRDDPGVKVQLLDVDASGGTSDACADAIRASINKLREVDDDGTTLLHGQTTDSGGGGVLEDLHSKMEQRGVCVEDQDGNKYLIANCCIHSLQIQLANAVRASFGEGSIDKVNATQLLHTAYRLQESIDNDQWRHILFKSSQFLYIYDATVDNGDPNEKNISPTEKNKRSFLQSFAKVHAFSNLFKKPQPVDPTDIGKWKDTIYSKLQAPILTRWWTVGVASSYLFDYYLVLFHACQTVINMYPSTNTPYAIASDLFSLMLNQETFLDVALIRGFHKSYLNKHLDWMQSCDDLTSEQGFQSHNIAVRYYQMERDIDSTMWDPAIKEYRSCVERWEPNNGQDDRDKHLDKIQVFYAQARTALHKHFKRWLSPTLLPCGLMSEAPLAKVISRVILGQEFPTSFGSDVVDQYGIFHYKSAAHDEVFNLKSFDRWLRGLLEDGGDYSPETIIAATLVAADVDLRSFDYQDVEHGATRWHMHSTYLPLASQTQFVERGVKEAKYVSATDRSEEHRSCMAIIRSHTPLGRVKLDDSSYNASKILSLIESSKSRSSQHNLWQVNQEDHQYDARYNQIRHSLAGGHFKVERVQAKKDVVNTTGFKYKKPNIAQQIRPQTKTYQVKGLVPYGKLVQARNMDDLRIELLFRGISEEDIPAKVSGGKEKLKLLECERLINEENMTAQDAAKHKAFKRLSEAPFELTE